MPMNVNDFIASLIKFRDAHPDHGKADVMIERDHDIAFEFHSADLAVATHEAGMHIEKFLVLSPNERGKRLELRPKIQRQ